jgi:polysaccharide pyruvyl transferase WcaK-like protein
MCADRRPRILVEPSDYTFHNLGDIAMLETAIDRLASLWPSVGILVLTDDPRGLRRHRGTTGVVQPLDRAIKDDWLAHDARREAPVARDRIAGRALTSGRGLSYRWPILGRRFRHPLGRSFGEQVAAADLILVSGMGGITDWFEEYSLDLLETVALAQWYGRPTALMGQGIGPIDRPRLLARCREVLAQVDLIALREGRTATPLLASLGVPEDRVMITGDDAVEAAFARRPPSLGPHLGLNVRVGWYSGVDDGLVERLGTIISASVLRLAARVVSVPVSRTPGEEDDVTFRRLLGGDRGDHHRDDDVSTPAGLIARIGTCRVVVTGSYHAGVFALAQGIPSICLVGSSYYDAKFEGLAELFGKGAVVVRIDDRLETELPRQLERLWLAAERLRPGLLGAAKAQIRAGHTAYERLVTLVERGARGRPELWRTPLSTIARRGGS